MAFRNWLKDVIEEYFFVELYPSKVAQYSPAGRCVVCKGSKFLCGKKRCPIIVRYYFQARYEKLIDSTNIFGSSPPGVFIGRIGYPYVHIGPLIPPIVGATGIYDTPEHWVEKSIDEIVNFRSQLVRGKYRVHVGVPSEDTTNKIVDLTRELALAKTPTDANAVFSKKPSGKLLLDDDLQPFGPSAPLKKLAIDTVKFDEKIEKAYYDGDLKATDAVLMLYEKGTLISSIQRAFSVGAFGLKKKRKFVPTRWSITAVDSIISKTLLAKIKEFPSINDVRVYETTLLDNRWQILMYPSKWKYELIEGWYPKTVWNPYGDSIVLFSSHEFYSPRSTYAEIGGCYYAARLAIAEKLDSERRQAGVVVFREAHPGYIMPVGVWNVRESVRNALKKNYKKFSNLKEALLYVSSKLEIPIKRYLQNSAVLQNELYQRKIEDYVSAYPYK